MSKTTKCILLCCNHCPPQLPQAALKKTYHTHHLTFGESCPPPPPPKKKKMRSKEPERSNTTEFERQISWTEVGGVAHVSRRTMPHTYLTPTPRPRIPSPWTHTRPVLCRSAQLPPPPPSRPLPTPPPPTPVDHISPVINLGTPNPIAADTGRAKGGKVGGGGGRVEGWGGWG